MRTFKRGDKVRCKYDDFEFTGTYINHHSSLPSILVQVDIGTGHKMEFSLHDGDGSIPDGTGWWVTEAGIAPLELQYDPSQQGDTDEDI